MVFVIVCGLFRCVSGMWCTVIERIIRAETITLLLYSELESSAGRGFFVGGEVAKYGHMFVAMIKYFQYYSL